jgi:hypothetical protein
MPAQHSSTETPHQIALQRFLAQRPQLREALEHLNPLQAQVAHMSLEQFREEHLHEAFEQEAERLGWFAWELTLQLTSASPEEFTERRLEVHREVAQMAAMDWREYCELNNLAI